MAPWEDWDYPRLVLYGLAVLVAGAVLLAASTSGAAFGVYNPAWDGASGLQTQAEAVGTDAEVIRDTAQYNRSNPGTAVAVILSPDRAYTDREATRVRRFVRRGGTLVVGEDFGTHSNALLAAVGASARIDGRLLRDERNNYRSPAMPVATNVSEHPLVENVDQLTLNHGTAVAPNNATVLLSSSEYGYLDTNENGDLDDTETMSSYPVATVESVGEGTVVVVSDASVAINAMLERSGNKAFLRSLFDGHEHALLDYSHAESLPPLALALLVVRQTPILQVGLGIVVIGGVALVVGRSGLPSGIWAVLGRRRDRGAEVSVPPVEREVLVDHLADERPDWDRERLERVVESIRDREN